MKLSGRKASLEVIWLVKLFDTINKIFEDDAHPYEPIIGEYLDNKPKQKKERTIGFDSTEDFDRAREKILNGVT